MKSSVEGMLTLYLYILDDLEDIGVFTDEEAQAIANVVHEAEERHRERCKRMFENRRGNSWKDGD